MSRCSLKKQVMTLKSCCFLSAGHEKLMAVNQQQLLFAELRDTFARRLTNHLNNVFVHQVTGIAWSGIYFHCLILKI